MEQLNIFDCMYDTYKIDKPIRLIELIEGKEDFYKTVKQEET